MYTVHCQKEDEALLSLAANQLYLEHHLIF